MYIVQIFSKYMKETNIRLAMHCPFRRDFHLYAHHLCFNLRRSIPDLYQIRTFTNACMTFYIVLHLQALVGNSTFLMELVDGEKKYRLTNNSR